jgi:hypothetical protein
MQTFDQWMKDVDKYLLRKVGLTHSDLPDFPSYDMWSDGISAEEAAQDLLEEEGFTDGED